MNKEQYWLIWSIEHHAWWKPKFNGYTNDRNEAGVYSSADAFKVVKSANIGLSDTPNEAMILFED